MSSTDVTSDSGATSAPPKPGEMKLEVIPLPVSDADRAKEFYARLGWRLDADLTFGDVRVVQFTPPGSGCSISFGKGLTSAEPGSAERLEVAVVDIDAAREELIGNGAEVSEPFHRDDDGSIAPGPHPKRRSYFTYATFSDPDGNSWLLQEITERLPGR
jgi:catechol 2,3-dioxygenase-like lactoylglutathione lyase family enzyme